MNIPCSAPVLVALLLSGCVTTKEAAAPSSAEAGSEDTGFTRQDRLRGLVTPERAWWDLLHYDLALEIRPQERSLQGSNRVSFQALQQGRRMQIDLQPPLQVTRVLWNETELRFVREGNVYWIDFPQSLPAGEEHQVEVHYKGIPQESKNPPWSGGLTWDTDELGNPFIATTCQGIGASIWWPNKDHGADEPDRGIDLTVTVPDALTAVCNGRLTKRSHDATEQTRTFHWQVSNPINNYAVNLNIGNYISLPGSYQGKAGTLDLEYWVLEHQREAAEKHFQEVPRTLAAFEHWFGPYPFYQDSYKIVVVPYLGMEHQSSVTYGNGFQNGYRGRDLSDTGVGLKFDFIIVHETAHEWWGNNISMRDSADMWIHESFANYSENLFVEYHFSEEEAQDYVIGCRNLIRNDRPIIGPYGVNGTGSGDMYYKGGNVLHTMRHILNDDERWLETLRGVNQEFWHRTVTTAEIESYISRSTGFDFGSVFDQYLRTTQIPILKYSVMEDSVRLWWDNVVPGFAVPTVLAINGRVQRITVSETPIALPLQGRFESLELDRNFYRTVEKS
jgi:aminopeptidase N